MHGFFIDTKLYARTKAVINPFEYDEYRRQRIREKIEAQRAERITIKARTPKVNASLAEKLLGRASGDPVVNGSGAGLDVEKEKKKRQLSAEIVSDPRFRKVFENPAFEIDETSKEYKLINPSQASQLDRKKRAGENKGLRDAGGFVG